MPKPLPISGPLPSNFIKPGGPLGPTSYNDQYPATFDVFVWGGYRTYGTLAERNQANYRKVGMLAFVSETTNTYRLMPDLVTWVDAYSTSGGGISDNIYTADGAITGNRIVDVGANILLFSGATNAVYRITTGDIQLYGNRITNTAGTLYFTGTNSASFVSPNTVTLSGSNLNASGSSRLALSSPAAVAITGGSITNHGTKFDAVSEGSASISAATSAALSGATAATLSSPGIVSVTGGSITNHGTKVDIVSEGSASMGGTVTAINGSVSTAISSVGPIKINGISITNTAQTSDSIFGQRMNTTVSGPASTLSETFSLVGTNLISLATSCLIDLNGNEIDSTSAGSTSIKSFGPITISGLSITNVAGRIDVVSTAGIGISAATTALVNASTLNLTSSTALNVSSIGPVVVNGSTVTIAGTTNASTAATGDVIINANDLRIITDEIRAGTATNGFVLALANTNGRVNFSPVIGGGVITDGSVSATKMAFSATNSVFTSDVAPGPGVEGALGPEWFFSNGMLMKNYANIMLDVNSWGYATTGDAGWTLIGTGSAGQGSGVSGHSGLLVFQTLVGTNTFAAYTFRADSVDFEAGNKILCFTKVSLPVLSVSGGNAYRTAVGFGDVGSAVLTDTDCITFTYSADENAGKWSLDCGAAGVHTVQASTITAVAGTYYNLFMIATSTNVDWWIDGVQMTSVTTNIPSGANKFSPQMRVVSYNGNGATQNALTIDSYHAKGFYKY